MNRVAIIGAGSWGTALAASLGRNGKDVVLWARRQKIAEGINKTHRNVEYVSEYELPSAVRADTDMERVCAGADVVIVAVPSLYFEQTVRQLAGVLPSDAGACPLVGVLTKGFIPDEEGRPQFVLDALARILPNMYENRLAYVAGPSHGEEVVQGKVTGLIATSKTPMTAIRMREVLRSPRLLVFSSLDTIGVQVCGAVKNVIAIAFGMLDALAEEPGVFGDNAESFLLAGGLNEIQTIGRALGATHPETFTSIAGVGDLDVTCRSQFGRNRRFGRDIIKKQVLEQIQGIDHLISNIENIGYLPEGVPACKYVFDIAKTHGLKLPICAGLYAILNKERQPLEFIESLLSGG